MELKEYQTTALEAFERWLSALDRYKEESLEDINYYIKKGRSIPDYVLNYPQSAWKHLAQFGGVAESSREYISRFDSAHRPIPHVCFKVPTGGGKTLLAVSSLERLNLQNGLTLWITPTSAIYKQTKAALWNREHPYRQILERTSGGRVKLLEKDVPFTKPDVANYLCVMLLMLPATNREKSKDFLRMFRDSGRYSSLFPDSDDERKLAQLLTDYPDLECVSEDGPIKNSLFNVFKMLRPIVVLDEAHKAYGAGTENNNEEFVRSVNRLNPRLVIELSATPNPGISNLLVDITGVELKNEEMIKLPVQVTSFTNTDWRFTLSQAYQELEQLAMEAQSLQQNEGRYIRPIAVVRVERTGKDQRDGERVHAEDVREYLVRQLGVSDNAIRVKSATKDELGSENLLSEFSQVRWIITKAALMEGWDCPFAYLLVMLDNTTAERAITQLMGRVMRQPHAQRTQRARLDQCYVYCWNTEVGIAVGQVKRGLEKEGLTGLSEHVIGDPQGARRVILTRTRFKGKEIYLPLVLHQDGDGYIELDYQRHILSCIDWAKLTEPDPLKALQGTKTQKQVASVDVGNIQTIFHDSQELVVDKSIKVSWFARRLTDIIPNSWQASRISQRLVDRLRESSVSDEKIYDLRSYLIDKLREHVTAQIEKQAEKVFSSKLFDGVIRFDLQAGQPNFQIVDQIEVLIPENSSLLAKPDGNPVQLSLFSPIFTQNFDSDLERKFALYLDEQKALRWWHKIAVRQQGNYYLRGWKQERIWPDFIAMSDGYGDKIRLFIFETKGEHLRDNPDTVYKKRVLDSLQNAFNCGTMTMHDGPAKGTFNFVFNEMEFPEVLTSLSDTDLRD